MVSVQQDELEYPWRETPAAGEAVRIDEAIDWIRMELPFALDHVNVWRLRDGDGVWLVDSGFALEQTRQSWQQILATTPVNGLVVTHCHPDHIGLAAWLEQQYGARVHMTMGEFLAAQALWHQLAGYSVDSMLAQFAAHGLARHWLEALQTRGNAYRRGVDGLPQAFARVREGDALTIDGQSWRVIGGYGHSPEHAGLYCAAAGVLISGDMLLPRISTNVSVFAAYPDDDPLGWFLDSLAALECLPADTLVLPSHGRPFRGLHARVAALRAHHAERCDFVLRALEKENLSAGGLMPKLFARELDAHQVMFAMGETIAHLNHLWHRQLVRRELDASGVFCFQRL